ncbi:MAG TPA: hypothetical protein VGB76_01760 [Pyrinomonadaceae bacterium]|jgi:hypothetical protein
MNVQTRGLTCGIVFDDEIPPPAPGEPDETDEDEPVDEEEEDDVEFA